MAAVNKMASCSKNKVNYLNTNSNVFFFCCSTTFIIQYGAVNECVKANKEREREKERKKNTTMSSEKIKSLTNYFNYRYQVNLVGYFKRNEINNVDPLVTNVFQEENKHIINIHHKHMVFF